MRAAVTQLSCAGRDLTEIPEELGVRFGALVDRLDLSFNALRSLRNLAPFRRLRELVLDNNELDDSLELPELPCLETLSLNKNRIADAEPLLAAIAARCPKLSFLSLLGNAACPNELVERDEEDYKRYRFFVLYMLPRLRFLDSRSVRAEERAEAARVGQFMRVVRPRDDEIVHHDISDPEPPDASYSALPSSDEDGVSRATFGVQRYVYYGRHSEGNRFIRNNDL